MIIEKIVEHARSDPDKTAIYYGEHRIPYGQFADRKSTRLNSSH